MSNERLSTCSLNDVQGLIPNPAISSDLKSEDNQTILTSTDAPPKSSKVSDSNQQPTPVTLPSAVVAG